MQRTSPDRETGVPWGIANAEDGWGSPEKQQAEHWEDLDQGADDIFDEAADFTVVTGKRKKNKKGKQGVPSGNAGRGQGQKYR